MAEGYRDPWTWRPQARQRSRPRLRRPLHAASARVKYSAAGPARRQSTRHPRRSNTPRSGKASRLSLHIKIVLTDQRHNLADLVWLSLTTKFLQGEDFHYSSAHEDTMTAATADFLEAQHLKQPDQIIEVHVPYCTRNDPTEQLLRSHGRHGKDIV